MGTGNRASLFMSGQKKQELNELFGNLDKNKEGYISVAQLEPVLHSAGISTETVVQMLKKNTTNDRVSHQEFTSLFASHPHTFKSMITSSLPNKKQLELKDAFDAFDKDNNGAIDAVELQKMMHHLGEKVTIDECKAMVAEADLDGDGVVNYDEFLVMMGVQPKKKKMTMGTRSTQAKTNKTSPLKRLFIKRSA